MKTAREPQTPPKQSLNDPNVADRRLTNEQKRELTNVPATPVRDAGLPLPAPHEVGEDG